MTVVLGSGGIVMHVGFAHANGVGDGCGVAGEIVAYETDPFVARFARHEINRSTCAPPYARTNRYCPDAGHAVSGPAVPTSTLPTLPATAPVAWIVRANGGAPSASVSVMETRASSAGAFDDTRGSAPGRLW